MRHSFKTVILVAIGSILCFAAPAFGQFPATGSYPYGTFDNMGFDSINVGNLNVHFEMPILNKTGRGIPLIYNLAYDSSIWSPVTVSGTKSWQPVQNWGWTIDGTVAFGYLTATVTTSTLQIGTDTCTLITYSNYAFYDSVGNKHGFNVQTIRDSGGPSCNASVMNASGMATDGSGYLLNATWLSGIITFPNGTKTSPLYIRPGSRERSGRKWELYFIRWKRKLHGHNRERRPQSHRHRTQPAYVHLLRYCRPPTDGDRSI
jgi:hypothetical protein